MRRRQPRTDRLQKTLVITAGSLLLAGAALADHGANRRSSSSSSSTSNQLGSHSRPAPRQQPPSRLLPPAGLGSAAGAAPGFYNRNLSVPAPPPSHHRGPARVPVAVPYPYPVYVLPPELAVSPSQVIAPSAQDIHRVSSPRYTAPRVERRAPAPTQPVIVIQQPAPAPQPARVQPPAQRPAPPPAPRSTEPAAVRFSIVPADAEVYLDDDLLGTGGEVSERRGMMLRPAVYVLEVTHPEHRMQRLIFGVKAEEPMEVVIDLTAERAGRRSRIR